MLMPVYMLSSGSVGQMSALLPLQLDALDSGRHAQPYMVGQAVSLWSLCFQRVGIFLSVASPWGPYFPPYEDFF